jgi:hypothetical protein
VARPSSSACRSEHNRFVHLTGTAPLRTTAIAEIGATDIAPQKGLVDQAAEHTDADIVAQPEQALRLRKRQAQPWHLAILNLDSPQELHPRREIPAIAMTIIVRVRRDPPGQRTNAEWSSRALRQLRANGINLSRHLRHPKSSRCESCHAAARRQPST